METPLSDQPPGDVPREKIRQRIRVSARILVGSALIIFLISKIDFAEGWETIVGGNMSLCLIAFFLFGLSRLAEGVRLFYLVPERKLTPGKAIEIVFVSTFFNNFGAMVAGDGYRVVALWKSIRDIEASIVVIIIDRILGVLAIVSLALAYAPFFGHRLAAVFDDIRVRAPSGLTALIGVTVAAGLVLGTAYLVVFRYRTLKDKIRRILQIFREIGATNWLFATVWSFVAQLAMTGMIFTLILAFGGNMGFADTMVIMLFVFVASYVPISFGSLGIREGAIVLGFMAFGITRPIAIAVALVSRIMIYQYAICAGIWLFSRRKRQRDLPSIIA